jgi:transcriptional regulator with XRE-family HTH domain
LDGKKIAKLRQGKGVSQAQLAEAAGITARTVSSALGGRPIFAQTARAIADALGVTPETISVAGTPPSTKTSEDAPGRISVNAVELETKLSRGRRASVSCFAYLAGDWSILETQKAFVLPIDARVHVSVVEDSPMSVEVFAWCAPETWLLDESASEFVNRLLKKILADRDTRLMYRDLPTSARVVIASETPRNVSVYEEGALAMALAMAMTSPVDASSRASAAYPARVAEILHRGWYPDVSPASLLANINDPVDNSNQVVWIHDPDLKAERAGIKRPTRDNWTFVDRDLPQLSVWWDGTAAAPVPRSNAVSKRLASLSGPLDFVIGEMENAMALDGEAREEQLGNLMQMHHQLLAYAGFVDRDAHELVTKVNGLTEFVRGAKLAGSRGRGAIVVLAKRGIRSSDLMKVLRGLGLKPLEEYRSKLHL